MKTLLKKTANKLRIDSAFHQERMIPNMTFIVFLAAIAIVYIWNTHLSERLIRKISDTNKEVKEVRWQYMNKKTKLMDESKQSQIAKQVEPLGLNELRVPPKKIVANSK